MKAATNKFRLSLRVDQGAFGPVFSGKIAGGKTKVAIKRRDPYSMHSEHEFHTEIEMSSKILHHNFVPLVGYCDEMGEMILVYNYMAHGCLRDHLYRTKQPPLTWNRRLEICIGAARGLHSLHTSQIIHGNVNTKKILLNEKWVAKITDLSLPKSLPLTEVSRMPILLAGCARPILDHKLPKQQLVLVAWALRCKVEGNLDQIVDPCLKGSINQRSLETFVGIAEKCLASEGIHRPSMGDVLLYLELALRAQGTVQG
ncbi:hypothetical protein SETIT_9G382500v2 [Setaria italica]|uniref:Protein kinase domain-containing protein n=1 Tax=Setaria italica TaxID=4555 RepID=A0A368SQ32_SETIT|nr:hypothetical protein SETIT_9G382500v2 [Setaria italica]